MFALVAGARTVATLGRGFLKDALKQLKGKYIFKLYYLCYRN